MLAFIGMLLLYFIVGLVLDVFSIIDLKAVQFKQAFKSAVVSFTSTMVSTYCYYYLIREPDAFLEILMFSLGGSVGTYYLLTKGYNEEGTELVFYADKRTKTGFRSASKDTNKTKKPRSNKEKPIFRRSLVLARSHEGKGRFFSKVVVYRQQARANANFLESN